MYRQLRFKILIAFSSVVLTVCT